jgi:hypothetical protein
VMSPTGTLPSGSIAWCPLTPSAFERRLVQTPHLKGGEEGDDGPRHHSRP